VTSTGEVLGPGGTDLIDVLLDQFLNFRDLLCLEKLAASSTVGSIQNFASPSAC